MSPRTNRRSLLQAGMSATAMLGLGGSQFLGALPRVSADESQVDPKRVQLDPSIEPLVRLIEETPRDRLVEEVATRIRGGLSYSEVLAALLLAGVRNVEPRPSVGFKFHAVLVVNSAHIASLSSPPEHRWLPIFWALDYFKSAAADQVRQGPWTMPPVDESRVPPAHKARQAFIEAMENWDEEAADAAVAGLARTAGTQEIFELFFRYGGRDFRSIGHKAIFVSNCWRTLACIGWQHAEPILRSLAYALLMHEGSNPAQRDGDPDRPFRRNQELVGTIRKPWRGGSLDRSGTETLLSTLRAGSSDDACDQVVELLNAGVGPQSIWDALLVGSGELLMRQSAIVALHAVTTTNALRFAFQTTGDDETRRLILLQNAAFLPLFREGMKSRGQVRDVTIGRLQERDADEPVKLDEIFDKLSRRPDDAAAATLAFLKQEGNARQMMDAARVLIFKKGNNAHDYKFSSAVLEDYDHVSPGWRDTFLAANVYKLRGSQERDNRLVERIQSALQG